MATRNFARDALDALLRAERYRDRATRRAEEITIAVHTDLDGRNLTEEFIEQQIALTRRNDNEWNSYASNNQWWIQQSIMYASMAILVRMGALRDDNTAGNVASVRT